MRRLRFAIVLLALAGDAVAAPRPDWVDNPPAPDSQFVYAVGEGVAKTRAEAEKLAVKDGLDRLAQQIEVQVSARTVSVLSTQGQESLSEFRQSIRSRIKGAEPVGSYIEAKRTGIPLFRKLTLTVRVLLRYPRAALEQERQRQSSTASEFKSAVDRLARENLGALRKLSPTTVAVGGFVEATSNRRYTLSTILEKDLADALVRSGITVVPMAQAKTLVTGGYRVQGSEIVVSARVRHVDTGEQVAAADAVFDKDAAEPAWLAITTPIDSHFEALEPARVDIRVRFGAVSVDSRPQGARVFLDGADAGRTPLDLREVPVGKRAISLMLPDYETYLAQVRVVEGESSSLAATLKPKTGDLDVRSVPSEAEVMVEGRNRGKTPLKLTGLRIGPYHLSLRHPEADDYTADAVIRAKATTLIDAKMAELPGSLFVISDPPGATILVDGVEVGKAAAPDFLRVSRVAAGTRKVEAIFPGRGSWQGEARVRARQVTQVSATVEDQRGILRLSLRPPEARVSVDDRVWFQGESGSSAGRMDDGRLLVDTGSPGELSEADIRRSVHDTIFASINPAPRTLTIPLPEGRHRLRVIGYEQVEREVSIKAGSVTKLSLDLRVFAVGDRHPKSPAGAIAAGLAFPGAGQLYASNEFNSGQDRAGITFVTTALLAYAGTWLYVPPGTRGAGFPSGAHEPKLGMTLLSLAGIAHVLGALDGGRIVATDNGSWAAQPIRDDAGTVGVYFLSNLRANPNPLPSYQEPSGTLWNNWTITPKSFTLQMLGGGVRYFPVRRAMIDVNGSVNTQRLAVADTTGTGAGDGKSVGPGSIYLARGTVNWVEPFGSVRTILGGGISGYWLTGSDLVRGNAVSPAIRGGIEYRPESHLGLSFLLNYDFISMKGRDKSYSHDQFLQLNGLSFEPTVAVYF